MGFDVHLAALLDDRTKRILYNKPFLPQPSVEVSPNESVINQVCRKDILLSCPYESMEKARIMQSDGTYRKKPDKRNKINIQELQIEEAKVKAITRPNKGAGVKERIIPFITRPLIRLERYLGRIRGNG